MDGTCGMHGGKKHACWVLLGEGKGFKVGDRLEGQGVDGRIMAKWIVKK